MFLSALRHVRRLFAPHIGTFLSVNVEVLIAKISVQCGYLGSLWRVKLQTMLKRVDSEDQIPPEDQSSCLWTQYRSLL